METTFTHSLKLVVAFFVTICSLSTFATTGDTTKTFTNRALFEAEDTCTKNNETFDAQTPFSELTEVLDGLITFEQPYPTVFHGSWNLVGTGGDFSGGALLPAPYFEGANLRINFSEPVFGFGANVFDDFDGATLINEITLKVTTTLGIDYTVTENYQLYGDCGFLGATSGDGIISAEFSINDTLANLELDLFEVILLCPCTDTDADGICDDADNCPTTPNGVQGDDDCDNVGNNCDLCPNGDDSQDTDGDGRPDCSDWDGIGTVNPDWTCGTLFNRVMICHNGSQMCISPLAVPARLQQGDYIGYCNSSLCPNGAQSSPSGVIVFERPEMEVYPNPSAGEFNLILEDLLENASQAVISDVTGRIIASEKLLAGESSHFIRVDLPKGMYIVKIMDGNELIAIQEVIIAR